MKNISHSAAEILLDLKCINFSPKKQFKLTSGKKSPVYCDCRRIISFPKERKKLVDMGIKKIKKLSHFNDISNIAGGESAGITFAAFFSSSLGLPMTYIRKKKKSFGKNSQIEGILTKKDNVLLIEDLMTDGGSKLNFLKALHGLGAHIAGMFVIFNYGIVGEKYKFKQQYIDVIYLTDWKSVLKVAFKKKMLSESDIKIIEKFLLNLKIKN